MDSYTKKQIREIVEIEGLEYAILDYVGLAKIKNKTLNEAWKTAYEALTMIRKELDLEY